MPFTFPTDYLDVSLYHSFEDDFNMAASATASDVTAWATIDDSGTGTNAFLDTVSGGVYNIVTAAADNDYHAMRTFNKSWAFAANKPLWFEARFRLAEATTLESTWWVGFTDTTTTGGFTANTTGPLASYTGALVYKTPETALTVNAQASAAAVQSTLSAIGTTVSNTFVKVQLYWNGTTGIVPHFFNGTSWVQASLIPFAAGTTQMYALMGVKAGPTAAAETLGVDYVKIVQTR